jgi:hypothetical protein
MTEIDPVKTCETCVLNPSNILPEALPSMVFYGIFTGKLPMPKDADLHTIFSSAHNFLTAQESEDGSTYSAYHEWMEANPGIMKLVDTCFDAQCLAIQYPVAEETTFSTLDS